MVKSINRRISEALTGRAGTLQSDTAPASPNTGDLWYDTTELALYTYYTDDSDVSYWVSTQPSGTIGGSGGSGSGVTTYADLTARDAATPSAGDMAWVTSNSGFYIYDGSAWDRVYAGVDTGLNWDSSLASPIGLERDGTPYVLTSAATDPEGFGITYSYSVSPTNQTQATISQDSSVFTLTPSTTVGDAGEFTLRLVASDGLTNISRTSTIRLAFSTDIVFPNQTGTAITITNGDDNSWTYTNSTLTSTGNYVYSNDLDEGKKYFEIRIESTNSEAMIGIAPTTADATLGYNDTGAYAWYEGTGTLYPGNLATGHGTLGANDILQIAYDTSTGELWLNVNNGTWYPNAPTSSSSLTIAAGAVKILQGSGASAAYTGSYTALYGTNTIYTPPTGFTAH